MDPFLFTLVAAGTIGATWTLYLALSHGHQRIRELSEAARACGLTPVGWSVPSLAGPVRVTARSRKLQVSLSEERFSRYGEHTHIVIAFPTLGADDAVTLRPQHVESVDSPEIEVGEERFDSIFHIAGVARRALALLDVDTRRLLLTLHGYADIALSPDALQAAIRVGSPAKLDKVLPLALRLVRKMTPEISVVRHMAANAANDPMPAVRLNNILCLLREFPARPETLRALRMARSDASAEIRLRAAIALGHEGRETLRHLAESASDDRCAAAAIEALDAELAPERVSSVLDGAVAAGRTEVARACIAVLGRHGGAAAVERLAPLMETVPELAVDAARALGTTGLTSAEPPLIQALARDSAPLQSAAAQALGVVGTATAVLPLKEAAAGHGNKDLERAARQAVAAIQERLTGASPGQLSLSSGTGSGQLSIAESGSGHVSQPDPDK